MGADPVLKSCDRTPLCTVRTDGETDATPSIAILEALAEADGVDPLDLESLYTVVDGEALDRLFAHRSASSGRPRTVCCLATDEKNVCVDEGGVACVCDADGDDPF